MNFFSPCLFVCIYVCVLASHCIRRLDFAPSFNTAHPLPYAFAEKILQLLPEKRFSEVFFTMCGSTAVDTALKIALAYNRARGQDGKVLFVGRERGYHGVGFGGVGVVCSVATALSLSSYSPDLVPSQPRLGLCREASRPTGRPSQVRSPCTGPLPIVSAQS